MATSSRQADSNMFECYADQTTEKLMDEIDMTSDINYSPETAAPQVCLCMHKMRYTVYTSFSYLLNIHVCMIEL